MTFRVGQKVVCVENLSGPQKDDVCTIINVYLSDDDVMIELAEFPNPEDDEYFAGWMAKYFRPAVEGKTDISIFTKMLTGSKIGADA
jgi:hypothetical protein